jgi:hypothetical protein
VSLRKSPGPTPALLASNGRNAKKSTGPRTARGKAWSRLNHMRNGRRSPVYFGLVTSLFNAPPGWAGATAQALLSSKLVVHPLFTEVAEICAQAEIHIGNESRWETSRRDEIEKRNSFFNVRSRNVIENKRRYDHLPENKATFLRHFAEFCRNRQLFCHFSHDAG